MHGRSRIAGLAAVALLAVGAIAGCIERTEEQSEEVPLDGRDALDREGAAEGQEVQDPVLQVNGLTYVCSEASVAVRNGSVCTTYVLREDVEAGEGAAPLDATWPDEIQQAGFAYECDDRVDDPREADTFPEVCRSYVIVPQSPAAEEDLDLDEPRPSNVDVAEADPIGAPDR